MAYTRNDYMNDLYISEHAHGVEKTNARFRANMYERGRAGQLKGYALEKEDDQDPEFYDVSFTRVCGKVCAANELENFKTRIRDRYGNYEIPEGEQQLLHQISQELRQILAFRKSRNNYQAGSPQWDKLQDAISVYEEKLETLLSDYHSTYYKPQREAENKGDDTCFRLLAVVLVVLCLLPVGCTASCILNG